LRLDIAGQVPFTIGSIDGLVPLVAVLPASPGGPTLPGAPSPASPLPPPDVALLASLETAALPSAMAVPVTPPSALEETAEASAPWGGPVPVAFDAPPGAEPPHAAARAEQARAKK
jgi:hypothetical protein